MALNSDSLEFSFRTRERTWENLKSQKDVIANVVIIGGGIVGAGLLRELALQQVPRIFLFEKNDFASGTSGNSSKLIHAGLRYLEQSWIALKRLRLADAFRQFRFVWTASLERKILGRLAPHLVKPKKIHFILREDEKRNPVAVSFGIWTYYLMQILQGQFFPPPQFAFSRHSREELAPDIDHSKTSMVFSFWDSETDDARLVIETLQTAHDLGATALNYIEVARYARESGKIRVHLRNRETGEEITIHTDIVINAAGPLVDEVRRMSGDHPRPDNNYVDRVAGAHIDIHPAVTDRSYYVSATDDRLVFFLKRNEDGLEYTRIGTTERPLKKDESAEFPRASGAETEYLMNTLCFYVPNLNLANHILKADAGVRPLRAQHADRPFDKSREHAIFEDNGVIHVVGVKLTDFRRVAAEILARLPLNKWGVENRISSRSKTYPYRHPPNRQAPAYGETGLDEVIRRTMVVHWQDYVLRRRGFKPLVLRRSQPEALEEELRTMARLFGWDDKTRENERLNLPVDTVHWSAQNH